MGRLHDQGPAEVPEEVTRGPRVETILGELVPAGEQLEAALVDSHHQGVPAAAERAVARRQLGKIGLDAEANGAAMTASVVGLRGAHATQAQISATITMTATQVTRFTMKNVIGTSGVTLNGSTVAGDRACVFAIATSRACNVFARS